MTDTQIEMRAFKFGLYANGVDAGAAFKAYMQKIENIFEDEGASTGFKGIMRLVFDELNLLGQRHYFPVPFGIGLGTAFSTYYVMGRTVESAANLFRVREQRYTKGELQKAKNQAPVYDIIDLEKGLSRFFLGAIAGLQDPSIEVCDNIKSVLINYINKLQTDFGFEIGTVMSVTETKTVKESFFFSLHNLGGETPSVIDFVINYEDIRNFLGNYRFHPTHFSPSNMAPIGFAEEEDERPADASVQ